MAVFLVDGVLLDRVSGVCVFVDNKTGGVKLSYDTEPQLCSIAWRFETKPLRTLGMRAASSLR